MAIIADGLDNLSKESSLSSFQAPNNSTSSDSFEILKILQQTSEGLSHLSIQWPNYANSYDASVLEVLKLIQVIALVII